MGLLTVRASCELGVLAAEHEATEEVGEPFRHVLEMVADSGQGG